MFGSSINSNGDPLLSQPSITQIEYLNYHIQSQSLSPVEVEEESSIVLVTEVQVDEEWNLISITESENKAPTYASYPPNSADYEINQMFTHEENVKHVSGRENIRGEWSELTEATSKKEAENPKPGVEKRLKETGRGVGGSKVGYFLLKNLSHVKFCLLSGKPQKVS